MNLSHSSTQDLISVQNSAEKMSDDYGALVAGQREFFRTGKTRPLAYRVEQLRKLRDLIIEETPAFQEAVYQDLRRKGESTQLLELSSMLNEIDLQIRNIEKWSAPTAVQRTLLTVMDTMRVYKEPKGVVLVIGPWNFPIWCVLGPVIDAIAAGNTVVVKPSEIAPHTAKVFERFFSKFPSNYMAVVQGGVSETTELLRQHFDHIIYTGNTTVGHIVMEAAAKHLTTVTLELGGKSPVVVLSDVDVEVTARRLVWGKTANCGQTCIAPDYLIVTQAIKARLVAAMIATARQFYGEEPQRNEDYSRIINERHFRRLASLLENSAGEVLYKGGTPDAGDLFIPPVFLDVKPDDVTMKDEVFGPILPIVTVKNLDEAIQLINDGPDAALAAYIFTRDEASVDKFIAQTRSGCVVVNDVMMQGGAPYLHFGGFGKSGMGRYRGKAGFDELSHQKAVLKRGFFGDSLTSARYPPVTNKKVRQILAIASTRPLIPPCVWSALRALPSVLVGAALGYLASRYFPAAGRPAGSSYRY